MPHIDVKMFPGRDDELKKAFAEKLVETAMETLGAQREHLSVSITDIKPEEWNEKIADNVADESLYAGKVYRV